MDNKINNQLNQWSGKIKETAGKMVHSDQMELKGKLQVMGSEISEKGEEIKEKAANKANGIIDKIKNERGR
ncbi:CsbD family protein [Anaerocolumna chitinilytica]|uniref:CsbD family protein n=1 Tax=Anaerocolumna chitinilytica TaxID=1727145 RepID=A0A7I8DH17_9FIRM|nr:CsbD family protein [Anaerocolumna chitinilytica]BCJ97793.1 hypothetical protein bsdcttw_08340 [Anaerocolumna chitinilytica]